MRKRNQMIEVEEAEGLSVFEPGEVKLVLEHMATAVKDHNVTTKTLVRSFELAAELTTAGQLPVKILEAAIHRAKMYQGRRG